MPRLEPQGEMSRIYAQPAEVLPWEQPEVTPAATPTDKKKKKDGSAKKAGGATVVLIAILKALAGALKEVPLLAHLAPVGVMALSMLFMLVIYAKLFTWAFAVGLLVLLFTHEMGHYLAASYYGVEVSLPLFIPFFGAVIRMKQQPQNPETEAKIAFAGPLAGTLGAVVFLLIYLWTGQRYGLAFAYTGFLLNLFNLIPVYPLDGGRVAAAISPLLWLIGIPVCVLVLFYSFNPFLLLILIPGVFHMFAQLKKSKRTSDAVTPAVRAGLAIAYFGLALFLALGVVYAQGVSRALGM